MTKTYRKFVRCSVCSSKIHEGEEAILMNGKIYCNERCVCDEHWHVIDDDSVGNDEWDYDEDNKDDFDWDGYNDDKKLGLI